MSRRRPTIAALACLLLGGGGIVPALLAPAAAAPEGATIVSTVSLLAGDSPATRPFPDDTFTVADPAQQSGRRVALPAAGCDAAGRSLCDDLSVLNRLDGFDLQPRVTLPFSGPVDLLTVTPQTVHVVGPTGADAGGLVSLVFDPASNTVSGTTAAFLDPDSTYTLVVTSGVKALDTSPVDVCKVGCPAGATERRVPFTTMTATATLDSARQQLDSGSAYGSVGIDPAQTVDLNVANPTSPSGTRSVYTGLAPTTAAGAPSTTGSPVKRTDQVKTDPTATGAFTGPTNVTDLSGAAYQGFGSIMSPQYVDNNAVIAQVPTRSQPQPQRAARIGVSVISATPPTAPATATTCLRPVIFGPGFSRSKFDLFVASAQLSATSGLATTAGNSAVFSTEALGHAFGPGSSWTVTHNVTSGGTTTLVSDTGSTFGRGHDLDGNGAISSTEGSQPTYTVDANGVPSQPSPNASVGTRDGLIQTVIDNMALVRALEKGVDINGDGTIDTCVPSTADPHPVTYFGQSFGGIYGTMLLGTDPEVKAGVPDVPGGPITEVARLGGFRVAAQANLLANKPSLLNGGPGLNGFTESLPLRRDARVTDPRPGAISLQQYFARSEWVQRPGGPETLARRLAPGGAFAGKPVLFQTAYGDGTVPNPTAANIYRSLGDYSKVWIFRNDRTATFAGDPHGVLLFGAGSTAAAQAQGQVQAFLTTGAAVDPDGTGNVWEQASTTGSNGTDYPAQIECLHYADPQTGQTSATTRTGGAGTAGSADCTDLSGTVTAAQPRSEPTFTVPVPPTPVPAAASLLTLRVSRVFVKIGERQTFSGALTRGGVAVISAPITLTERYSDGHVVTLGTTTTGAAGAWAVTVRPLYNGIVTASAAGAPLVSVASRVAVTYRSVRATVAGTVVTVAAETRPGFVTGRNRQERVQLLLVDGSGRQLRVLAVANAETRRKFRGEAQGTNKVSFRVTLPAGTARLVVKVIGTPVNTGAAARPVTVRIS